MKKKLFNLFSVVVILLSLIQFPGSASSETQEATEWNIHAFTAMNGKGEVIDQLPLNETLSGKVELTANNIDRLDKETLTIPLPEGVQGIENQTDPANGVKASVKTNVLELEIDYEKINTTNLIVDFGFSVLNEGQNIVFFDKFDYSSATVNSSDIVRPEPAKAPRAIADITGNVQISHSVVTVNGEVVSGTNQVVVGDVVGFQFFWKIDPVPNVDAGSTFTVTLPSSEFFRFKDSASDYILRDAEGVRIGTYKIENSIVIVTLEQEGVDAEKISGNFQVYGTAKKEGNSDGGGNGNGSPITVLPNPTPTPDPEDGPSEVNEYPEEDQEFEKGGYQVKGQNLITWKFNVNHTSLGEMVDTFQANGQVAGNTIEEQKAGILVDHLPAGVKFNNDSMWITVPVNIMTEEGKLATYGLGDGDIQVHDAFVRINPKEDETYEDFFERVRNYPHEEMKRAYGVYKHSNGRESVLVAVGDTPGSDAFYYDEINGGVVETLINRAGYLKPTQKDELRKLYGIGGDNAKISPSKGQIVAYDVSFQVIVEGGSGNYENEATYITNEVEKESATHVDFQEIGGSAELENLTYAVLQKTDEETGDVLKGAEFELYKNGVHEKTYTTNEYGKIQTDGLAAGNYELVESKAPSGYVLDPTPIPFTVETVSKPTFVNFTRTNKNTYKFAATKTVAGVGTISGTKEFKFEIQNGAGKAVAYGKTSVNNKNTSYPIEFYKEAAYTNKIADSQWGTILQDGSQYKLVETSGGDYAVSYSIGGVNGNDFTVTHTANASAPVQSVQVDVTNKDAYDFKAFKEVTGSGAFTPGKVFEFELREATGTRKVKAYGKATIGGKNQKTAIEFFTQADYDPSSIITDWAAVLTEGEKYQLIEPDTQHYNVAYSGGSGTNNNIFEVVFNDNTKAISLEVTNADSFDFEATKKVTGTGLFTSETFKFELVNSSNAVVAYGKSAVSSKNTEVPITFYEQADNDSTEITDWADILTEGETYRLREVDHSGYEVYYTNQDGAETDSFSVTFNTGKKLTLNVENKRTKILLPKTGGKGIWNQLLLSIVILFIVVGSAFTIEYRRRKVGE
ncbi:prealbumin-like fold domain-containing protein [Enterococcus hulanensis]|uniref:prealbumin-like fold domain-containing protein n=1 Tax=Enterococcus hulanensis TaxID=2559929 RepID=UPI00288F615B|nr:prealbumin-like fold domain-containing protein [Enterococcus hulanensis]MDT2659177.1 prealbumin-like fold domain-containing protein [Enterococcus hulanensis]